MKELHHKPKLLGIHSIVHKVFHDKSVKNAEGDIQTKKLSRMEVAAEMEGYQLVILSWNRCLIVTDISANLQLALAIVHKVFHDKSVKNAEGEAQMKRLNQIQHVTDAGNEETLM